MEFYRTFIALPMEVGPEVHQLVDSLRQSLEEERISWVDPEKFHITIRFLGDTPLEQVKTIGEKLEQGINSPPINIRLNKVGSFGSRKHPRVVWIGLEPAAQIHALYRQTGSLLKTCGFPPEEQAFRPHLTLGRIRSLKDLNTYHRIIDSMDQHPLGMVKVDRMVYYRSLLGAGGPVYTPLYQVRFNDS
jgi:2'-5' RNA ligase